VSDSPVLFGPDGNRLERDAPRLVDARGHAVRLADGDSPPPPERPRLRALEILALREGGEAMLVVRDPLGVVEEPVVLRVEVLPLLQLLDGERSVEEIASRVVAETGDMHHGDGIRSFVADLDRLFLLESPRFETRRREVVEAYRAETVREPALAGSSYPADPDELRAFLSGHYAEAKAIQEAGAPAPPHAPVAIAAPHLDPRRAGAVTALAMLALAESPPPDLVIILGTGHSLYERTIALTEKTHRTPIGDLEVDREAVARLVERTGAAAFEEETAHRNEHSTEFTALHLAYRFGATPRILPVLCGGFHRLVLEGRRPEDDPLYAATLEGLRDEIRRAQEAGRAVAVIAAVDLSHLGARFGDHEPIDSEVLAALERSDLGALDAALAGDADRWFDAIAAHGDSTRICGYSALHALLSVTRPGSGTLLRYEQSVEGGGSVVSCAAAAWPARQVIIL
jgi:hypothetical protein